MTLGSGKAVLDRKNFVSCLRDQTASTRNFFNTIAQKFGWAASTAIYIPLTSMVAGLIFLINKKVKIKK